MEHFSLDRQSKYIAYYNSDECSEDLNKIAQEVSELTFQ